MNSFLIVPGRVRAVDSAEARALICAKLVALGYEADGEIRPYPCRVQQSTDKIWFEYYVRVGKK